jgi:hypothetical protein
MTKKDYIVLVRALRNAEPTVASESLEARIAQWQHCVNRIADALAADNSRFNRETFNKACGIQS